MIKTIKNAYGERCRMIKMIFALKRVIFNKERWYFFMAWINDKKKGVKRDKVVGSVNYYNKPAWKKLREAKMIEQPLCEECLAHGRVSLAEEVHHKRKILSGKNRDEVYKILLDPSNLKCLCVYCHKGIHRKMLKYNLDYCDSLTEEEYKEAHYLK